MGRATEPANVGYIYFIESPTQGAVKIGFAADVYQRLKSLQTGNPAPLDLIAYVRGTLGAEGAIHEMLRPWRRRLEWYPDCALVERLAYELEDEALEEGVAALAAIDPESRDVETFLSAEDDYALLTADRVRQIVMDLLERVGPPTADDLLQCDFTVPAN